MNANEIVNQLEQLGSESYKNILLNHGVSEPVFGVKVEDLKKIQKPIKKDYQLARDLFDTRIYDAQYLAGLIADEKQMTKRDLGHWISVSNSVPICGSVVAWVAAESAHGRELAREWIEAKKEVTAQTGWTTYSSLVAITQDKDLDMEELSELLGRVEQTIHAQANHVRYAMNGFVIAVGIGVKGLTEQALRVGKSTGKVTVDMGKTACRVPYAPDYIEKARARGVIGKKRRTARC